ncbi:hypothetical protein AB7M49_004094 [Bradyrhizobium elkanii]
MFDAEKLRETAVQRVLRAPGSRATPLAPDGEAKCVGLAVAKASVKMLDIDEIGGIRLESAAIVYATIQNPEHRMVPPQTTRTSLPARFGFLRLSGSETAAAAIWES